MNPFLDKQQSDEMIPFDFDDELRKEVLEMYGFDSEALQITINLEKLNL